MKKVVLTTFNINDSEFQKLRFEALWNKKSVSEVIKERLFERPFSSEVEESYNSWIESNIQRILNTN